MKSEVEAAFAQMATVLQQLATLEQSFKEGLQAVHLGKQNERLTQAKSQKQRKELKKQR